jgi:hypothetical protein
MRRNPSAIQSPTVASFQHFDQSISVVVKNAGCLSLAHLSD